VAVIDDGSISRPRSIPLAQAGGKLGLKERVILGRFASTRRQVLGTDPESSAKLT
jgi:hypothetical protein